MKITFVVPSNDDEVLGDNLLLSPVLDAGQGHEIIVQKGYSSAARAYNQGLARASNEWVVFVHQDIYLPETWYGDLVCAVNVLVEKDPQWGVLGSYGVAADSSRHGYLFCSGNDKVLGTFSESPQAVRALDEIILIIRKSSGLCFDEHLPHFHFYGTDICLTALEMGMNCYAMSAFLVHNTEKVRLFKKDFVEGYQYMARKWDRKLPVETPCITIERRPFELTMKRFKQYKNMVLASISPYPSSPRIRLLDPKRLLKKISYQTHHAYGKTGEPP